MLMSIPQPSSGLRLAPENSDRAKGSLGVSLGPPKLHHCLPGDETVDRVSLPRRRATTNTSSPTIPRTPASKPLRELQSLQAGNNCPRVWWTE